MKIAITTWFHYQNYGTALQVYALSTFLNNQGNDVDVVNYIPDGQVVSLPQEKMIVNYLEKIKKKIVSRKNSVIELSDKSDKFNDFLTNIRFTNRCSCISDFEMLNGKYDVFIVGSDQIWSPLSYDVRYFFDYINNPGKLISYAPSIGVNSIQDKYIEKNMTKGNLSVKKDMLPVIQYQPEGSDKEIPLYVASSIVSEISPLLLVLKSGINFKAMIIEEPEAHLHPELQQKMARLIINMMNLGIPVWITTHSDTILQHINNMMKLKIMYEAMSCSRNMDIKRKIFFLEKIFKCISLLRKIVGKQD